jgi:hypothetical protein
MATRAKSFGFGEPSGGEHGFELQVRQPEGRGLWWEVRAADMLGRRGRQSTVDHAGPVEPDHHRHAPADRGGFEPSYLLHPPHVQLHLRSRDLQRVGTACEAPGQVGAKVRLGVNTGLAPIARQVGGHGQVQAARASGNDSFRCSHHRACTQPHLHD